MDGGGSFFVKILLKGAFNKHYIRNLIPLCR